MHRIQTTKSPEHAAPHATERRASVGAVPDPAPVTRRSVGGYDFARVPVRAGIRIGSPSDVLEREADRVADRAADTSPMRTDAPSIGQRSDTETVRRTPVSPYSMSEGRIVEGEEEEDVVQAKALDHGASRVERGTSARVRAVVSGSGRPLPGDTRSFMEGRIGHDFGRVRIHTDGAAAEAAASIQARAFTRGAHVVFGRNQYAPRSDSGRWLLAHELTHVVQQGKARSLTATRPDQGPDLGISTEPGPPPIRRVNWGKATDTGKDSYPWGSGPKGDVYEVETDAGTKIDAWKPHDGKTYWCHGYTFGGSTASGGPFSIWGSSVPTVLQDDGWHRTFSCMSGSKDVLVFSGAHVAHSGIVASVSAPGSIVDEDASMLDSKWGQKSLNRSSWTKNALQYGEYAVYSKTERVGACADKGAHERSVP